MGVEEAQAASRRHHAPGRVRRQAIGQQPPLGRASVVVHAGERAGAGPGVDDGERDALAHGVVAVAFAAAQVEAEGAERVERVPGAAGGFGGVREFPAQVGPRDEALAHVVGGEQAAHDDAGDGLAAQVADGEREVAGGLVGRARGGVRDDARQRGGLDLAAGVALGPDDGDGGGCVFRRGDEHEGLAAAAAPLVPHAREGADGDGRARERHVDAAFAPDGVDPGGGGGGRGALAERVRERAFEGRDGRFGHGRHPTAAGAPPRRGRRRCPRA